MTRLKKTQAKLEKRKGKEDLKSYDETHEHQSEKEDTVCDLKVNWPGSKRRQFGIKILMP